MTTTTTQQAAFQALEAYARAVLRDGTSGLVLSVLRGEDPHASKTDIAYEVFETAGLGPFDRAVIDAVHDLVVPYLLARLAPEAEATTSGDPIVDKLYGSKA